MPDNRIPTPHPQTAATVVDGQAVIVMADSGQMTVLNEVGSRVWELCTGEHTLEQISWILTEEYAVDLDRAQADVEAFIEKMTEIGAVILTDA